MLSENRDVFEHAVRKRRAVLRGGGATTEVTASCRPAALLAAVELRAELGLDVNASNSMGLRAIHGAANRGSNDVIELLAARGARFDVPDAQGRTPLVWAEGVFLATHPPQHKLETIAVLERLLRASSASR